jgi:propanol-preferring alcohol dehydrogenase
MPVSGLGAVARESRKPLRIEEVKFRDPEPGEVLVRLHASGVCHTDLHAIDCDWPVKPNLPFIPGHEGVGIVVKAGHDVQNVKEGDRVGLPWLHAACGECEWCLTGWESLCPWAEYGGYASNGSFAEYSLAPANYVGHIPAGLTDVEAAPILCAGLSAWKALKESEVTAGQWVAVLGVGGVGQMVIQFALKMGTHVIAFDTNPKKLQRARELGVEVALNPRDPEAFQQVQRNIGGAHGVIVTASSIAAFRPAIDITRRKGTCVFVGLPPGEVSVPLFDVVLKRLTIRGSLAGTREDLQEALAMCADSGARAFIQTQPLATANDALDRLRAGKVAGRIVLTM